MKFFDLEMSGLAAGLGRASGNGAVTSVSYAKDHGLNDDQTCIQWRFTNGTSYKTCALNSEPGMETVTSYGSSCIKKNYR